MVLVCKFHIQRGVSGICKRRTTAVDTDSNTANEIAQSNSNAGPEESKASVVGVARVQIGTGDGVDLSREDNGHDDTVDGDDFAENDGDQVLCSDTRSFNTAAENRRSGNEDSPTMLLISEMPRNRRELGTLDVESYLPCCADDRKANA